MVPIGSGTLCCASHFFSSATVPGSFGAIAAVSDRLLDARRAGTSTFLKVCRCRSAGPKLHRTPDFGSGPRQPLLRRHCESEPTMLRQQTHALVRAWALPMCRRMTLCGVAHFAPAVATRPSPIQTWLRCRATNCRPSVLCLGASRSLLALPLPSPPFAPCIGAPLFAGLFVPRDAGAHQRDDAAERVAGGD